ncbi:Signal transduction histidine kinase [Klebsormidium nitens]|uniref:Signal transduction histidine kinase n=1 Tax=Klebsormidium nitens TaxID=105231 RepID=A0A1Y1I3B2_KLENI|nr:Signal transduction histidine kinase [Klebsormidium nitens]|eukprot:GAQ83899.1 Signal transduction histidine kinase [Klebsormidium nitens]
MAQDEEADVETGLVHPVPPTPLRKSFNILFLRLLMTVLFAVLLSGSAALTFVLTTRSASSSVADLACGLGQELLDRGSDNFMGLFHEADTCMRTLAGNVALINQLAVNETLVARQNIVYQSTLTTIRNCVAVNGVGVVRQNGRYSILYTPSNTSKPLANETLLLVFSNRTVPEGEPLPRFYAVLNKTTASPLYGVSSIVALDPLDFRQRAWYRQALTSADGFGSEIRIEALSGRPTLVLGQRVTLESTGEVVGVVALYFYLDTITKFLETFNLRRGLMYFTNGTHIVADSQGASADARAALIRPNESSSDVIRQADAYVAAVSGSNGRNGTTAALSCQGDVSLGGSKYYIQTKPVSIRGITFWGTLVMPRGAVMGQIDSNARHMKVIIMVTTIAFLIVGCTLIVLFTDPISKEMRLKAQVIENLEAKRRAETRDAFKTKFLATISHDLRNPSAAMVGLLDMVLETNLSSEQSEQVKQVKECALQQLDLLNEVLDFSKIEAGKMSLDKALFDPVEQLETLVELYGVTCAKKGLEILLEVQDAVPRTLLGDALRFRQVVSNLLSNSVKFTKDGFIRVRCSLAPPDESRPVDLPAVNFPQAPSPPGNLPPVPFQRSPSSVTPLTDTPTATLTRLLLEVEDTGCGVSPEKRDVIFMDYAQADGAATSQAHGGTGLGLGIVKKLVGLMGGHVAFADKPGPGCLVRFDVALENSGRAETVSETGANHWARLDVVLAMRPLQTRELVLRKLRARGASVCHVAAWEDALSAIQELARLRYSPSESVPVASAFAEPSTEPAEPRFETGPPLQGFHRGVAADHSQGVTSCEDEEQINCAVIELSLLGELGDLQQLEQLERELERLQEATLTGDAGEHQRQVRIVFVAEKDTPPTVCQVLKDHGFADIVYLPFYPSKLKRLVESLISEPITINQTLVSDGLTSNTDAENVQSERQSTRGLATGRLKLPEVIPGNLVRIEVISPIGGSKSRIIPHPPSVEPANGPPRPPLDGMRALVVDDNQFLRVAAKRALEKLGARVELCCDGMESVNALRLSALGAAPAARARVDFVLMDIEMPILDGYAATRLIRELEQPLGGRSTVIIAYTANASTEELHEACSSAGMNGVLFKPAKPSVIAEKVHELIT